MNGVSDFYFFRNYFIWNLLLKPRSKLTSTSFSLLALYILVMLSTFSAWEWQIPLGRPRSTSSLLRVVSETWYMTELLRMKYRVAATAFISYWSRPVPVSNFTVFVLCLSDVLPHLRIRDSKWWVGRRWDASWLRSELMWVYDFGEDWDFGDEPLWTAQIATELESHQYTPNIIIQS